MGLDFSHGEAHWSYSGFHAFRMRLGREVGIILDDMDGFGGTTDWPQSNDPIFDLLNHSDCDGELTAKQCKAIAPRLREIVSAWQDGDYDKDNALELAKGMDAAVLANSPLEFC